MAKLVDVADLKSVEERSSCRFESCSGHFGGRSRHGRVRARNEAGAATVSAAIRVARAGDRRGVSGLLTAAGLPLDGLSEQLDHFLVAEEDGRIVAAAGLERYDDSVLLRSVVVEPSQRGTGIGTMLSEAAMIMAQELGARDAYLLTDTAEAFFRRHGFEVIDRTEVPPGIRSSVEFAVACPASAIVMRRAVGHP